MSEWREFKIGDIISLEYGKGLINYRDSLGKYEVFGTNGKIGLTDQYIYDKPSIIIGRKGAYRGVHFANNPFFVIDTAFYTKTKIDELDTVFLFYWFSNIDINEMDSGSAIPSTSREEVYNLEIALPPLPEQKAIATVLSSLDDKIDLLHRQNKTLETMAETLFRQWFVEEADESWEEKTLSEIAKIGIGRTPPRKEFEWFSKSEIDYKWLSIKDMGSSNVFILSTSEYLTKEAVERFNVPIIPKDTVVLSFKMTLGRVAITSEEMLSNEAIAHFKINNNSPIIKEYLYLFLRAYRFDTLGSTSTIVTSINSQMIKDILITIPDAKLMVEFQKQTKPMFDKILDNQKQILTLEKLRDTLLPKLMSGEVRVNIKCIKTN